MRVTQKSIERQKIRLEVWLVTGNEGEERYWELLDVPFCVIAYFYDDEIIHGILKNS